MIHTATDVRLLNECTLLRAQSEKSAFGRLNHDRKCRFLERFHRLQVESASFILECLIGKDVRAWDTRDVNNPKERQSREELVRYRFRQSPHLRKQLRPYTDEIIQSQQRIESDKVLDLGTRDKMLLQMQTTIKCIEHLLQGLPDERMATYTVTTGEV